MNIPHLYLSSRVDAKVPSLSCTLEVRVRFRARSRQHLGLSQEIKHRAIETIKEAVFNIEGSMTWAYKAMKWKGEGRRETENSTATENENVD